MCYQSEHAGFSKVSRLKTSHWADSCTFLLGIPCSRNKTLVSFSQTPTGKVHSRDREDPCSTAQGMSATLQLFSFSPRQPGIPTHQEKALDVASDGCPAPLVSAAGRSSPPGSSHHPEIQEQRVPSHGMRKELMHPGLRRSRQRSPVATLICPSALEASSS